MQAWATTEQYPTSFFGKFIKDTETRMYTYDISGGYYVHNDMMELN